MHFLPLDRDHDNILFRLVVFEQRASQFGQFSALAILKFMRSPAMIVLSSKNYFEVFAKTKVFGFTYDPR